MNPHDQLIAEASANHGTGSHAHEHRWQGYLYILLVLLVLTIITVTASRINFGSSSANVVIAMTIATIKASLVALFFMHLKDDKPINGVIFVSTLLFLAVFLGFCLIDADTRWDTRPASYKGPVTQMALPSMDTDNRPKGAAPQAENAATVANGGAPVRVAAPMPSAGGEHGAKTEHGEAPAHSPAH